MQTDDLILISVDDHLIEPPDVFDNHLPAILSGRYPDDPDTVPQEELRRLIQ